MPPCMAVRCRLPPPPPPYRQGMGLGCRRVSRKGARSVLGSNQAGECSQYRTECSQPQNEWPGANSWRKLRRRGHGPAMTCQRASANSSILVQVSSASSTSWIVASPCDRAGHGPVSASNLPAPPPATPPHPPQHPVSASPESGALQQLRALHNSCAWFSGTQTRPSLQRCAAAPCGTKHPHQSSPSPG